MSTDHVLYSNGPVELCATERSAKVEIGVYDDREGTGIDTGAILSDEDLIHIIVKLLAVASYISDDPEDVRERLDKAIDRVDTWVP